MSMAYIRDYYRVPARRGARVAFEGRPGTIVGSTGPYLRIQLDGETGIDSYHPTWHIDYAAPAPAGRDDGGAE